MRLSRIEDFCMSSSLALALHRHKSRSKSTERGRTNLQATRSWQDMRCMQCPQTPPCTCPSRTPCTCRRCCPCTRRCTCSLRSRRFLHYTHVHKCRHTHASENLSMCMCACVCVCMHICAYACVCMCMCMHVHVRVCVRAFSHTLWQSHREMRAGTRTRLYSAAPHAQHVCMSVHMCECVCVRDCFRARVRAFFTCLSVNHIHARAGTRAATHKTHM
jgi:hypothetical protein